MTRWLFSLAVLAAVAVLPARTAVAADRVALVVGNGAYEAAAPLPNPANDAAGVATALQDLGFEVILAQDLSKTGFDQSLRDFSRAMKEAEVALFFYAGHGMQVDNINYLIPIDAQLESETDLAFEAVELAFVLRLMEQLVPTSLVFLDACRDNPMAQSLARSMASRSNAIGRGLARVESGIGTLIAYATQPGNVALDGKGEHSPFTAALLQHIATPGLEVRQILTRVRESVIAATGRQQVPWDHSSLTGDFYFLASAPPADTGAEVWQVIQHSNNPKDFEFFLQSFPQSPFVPYAKLRLENLTPAGPSAEELAAEEAAAAAAAKAQELQQALAAVEAKLAAEERARAEAEARLASEVAARAAAEAEAKRLAEAAALAEASAAATEQARQEALAEAEAARQEREAAEAALLQAATDKVTAAQALAEAERKNALAAEELARAGAEAQRLAEEAALAKAAAAANDQARQDALNQAEKAKQERAVAEQALLAAEERSATAQQALEQMQGQADPAAAGAGAADTGAAAPAEIAAAVPVDDAAADQRAALEAGEALLGLDRAARQRVQRALTLIGHDTRGVDGAFGKNSRAAIAAYQGVGGVQVTGYLDPATLARLMQEAEEKLAAWDKAEAERAASEAAAGGGTVQEAAAVVRNVTPELVASITRSIEGHYVFGRGGSCFGTADWTIRTSLEGNLIREVHRFAGQADTVTVYREMLSITQDQVDGKLYRQIDTVVATSYSPSVKIGTADRYRFTFTGHYLQLRGFKRC